MNGNANNQKDRQNWRHVVKVEFPFPGFFKCVKGFVGLYRLDIYIQLQIEHIDTDTQ